MTRQKKTDRQRAEEALGVAKRKHDRLVKEAVRRRAELAAVESDLADAERRLAYAAQDPALPQTPNKSTTPSTTTPRGDTA